MFHRREHCSQGDADPFDTTPFDPITCPEGDGNLAYLYLLRDRKDEAERYFEESIDIYNKSSRASHPHNAMVHANLARIYMEQARYSEAEPLLVESLAIGEVSLGAEHPKVAMNLESQASLAHRMGPHQ